MLPSEQEIHSTIFKGRPKAVYFHALVDITKGKLVAWKVSFLFVTGRVKLVRNFIWSDDIYKRNLVIMTWKHCCRDLRDGGLSIGSLGILNEASDLKQCWSVLNDHED
ncbi:hypothetical protein KIW84_056071 [Lathyrus oleraceus]|uniref:Uncharacterized protein n=1 Tax=Pisum sativum TaxID=3888 RepID=A0A9D5AGH4_PEA|nr:hypothetical protein KIW84_056071 [Pisum sativum]